ncbi:MAG: diguanylate cyclase [Caldimonas sp.]
MTTAPVRMLVLASAARAPGFAIDSAASWADVLERLAGDEPFDAVLVDGDAAPAAPSEVAAVAERTVLVVAVIEPDADHAAAWLRQGADDVIGRDELAAGSGWRRVRFAIERRRRASQRAAAGAMDPATGLPRRQQLVEHLSQLLALREREPAPMAVLAFRIEGLHGSGAGEAELLRRKIAVRLRAGVRGSDVVATTDDETFAVLLGSILAPTDADRVAGKLVGSLVAPFPVGGRERSIAVALGIAHYPLDGQDAERLLRRAFALAAAAPATAELGPAAVRDAAGAARAAANDER